MPQELILSDGSTTNSPISSLRLAIPNQGNGNDLNPDTTPAAVGLAEGGEQFKVYTFRSFPDAKRTLRKGTALNALQLGFKAGATAIRFVNALGGTASSKVFLDSAAATVFSLVTTKTRERSQLISYDLSVQADGALKFQYRDNDTGEAFGDVNIGSAFTLQYTKRFGLVAAAASTAVSVNVTKIDIAIPASTSLTFTDGIAVVTVVTGAAATPASAVPASITVLSGGAAVTAGMTAKYQPAVTAQVLNVSGAKTLQTTVTGLATDNLSIVLNSEARVRDLMNTINVTGAYSALRSRDANLLLGAVDLMATPVPITLADPVVPFKALKGDLALFFSTRGAGLVKFTAGASLLAPVATSGNFAGGVTTAATITDWATAGAALGEYQFVSLTPLTDDEAVKAGYVQIVKDRNAPRVGSFVKGFYGGVDDELPVTEGLADVNSYLNLLESRISRYNDEYANYVVSTGDTTDELTGELRRAKLFEAALVTACLEASVGPDQPISQKVLPLSNPYPKFDASAGQRDRLVRIGGIGFERVGVGNAAAKVIKGRTTYVGENNIVKESTQMMGITLAVARNLKALKDQYLPGRKAVLSQIGKYESAVNEYLRGRVEAEWLVGGTDVVTGEVLPPYSFTIFPTRYGSQLIPDSAIICPAGEFVASDGVLTVVPVNISVS